MTFLKTKLLNALAKEFSYKYKYNTEKYETIRQNIESGLKPWQIDHDKFPSSVKRSLKEMRGDRCFSYSDDIECSSVSVLTYEQVVNVILCELEKEGII